MMFDAFASRYQFIPQTFGITPQLSSSPGLGGRPSTASLMASQPDMLAIMNQLAQVLQAVSLLGGGFAEFAGAEQAKK